jgi:hypothetical protein
VAARGAIAGCGRERHLAARVGTIRNTGDDTINLWRQPHWLRWLQAAKVRKWTPIQIYLKKNTASSSL